MRPQPQPEVEAHIRETLKSLDELLDIVWDPICVYRDGYGVEGRYKLICRWPQGDPRWKLYYEGKWPDPHDILCWFCTDLQDAQSDPVNPDKLEQAVLKFLSECDNTRQSWRDRMTKSVATNLKVKQDARNEILDLAHDEFSYYQKKIAGESIIAVNSQPRGIVTASHVTSKIAVIKR